MSLLLAPLPFVIHSHNLTSHLILNNLCIYGKHDIMAGTSAWILEISSNLSRRLVIMTEVFQGFPCTLEENAIK
jgi:hypothetical protein